MSTKLVAVLLTAASGFGQTTLRQYLNLTSAQAATLMRLDRDYETYQRAQDNQASTLTTHLYNLLAQTAPDSLDLGNTAVSLELIRRDEAAKLTVLQANAAAQLTPAQATLVQNIDVAASLVSLVQDAQCAYVLKPQVSQWFDTSVFVPSGVTSGIFGFPVFPPIIPPAPTGSFCGSTVFPISVRDYLSLTDTQVSAIFQASALTTISTPANKTAWPT